MTQLYKKDLMINFWESLASKHLLLNLQPEPRNMWQI